LGGFVNYAGEMNAKLWRVGWVLLLLVAAGCQKEATNSDFEEGRASAEGKAIMENLRQFAGAGQQYMLDAGKNQAAYSDLVGPEPGKYIRELIPVAGEDYTHLVMHGNDTVLRVKTADGRVIEYRI
jgi:hypothetical protein